VVHTQRERTVEAGEGRLAVSGPGPAAGSRTAGGGSQPRSGSTAMTFVLGWLPHDLANLKAVLAGILRVTRPPVDGLCISRWITTVMCG
jgi:hypothetical protein